MSINLGDVNKVHDGFYGNGFYGHDRHGLSFLHGSDMKGEYLSRGLSSVIKKVLKKIIPSLLFHDNKNENVSRK